MVNERGELRIERLLDEAEEAVSRLEWPVVRDRALAVLAFDPDNSDAPDLNTTAERTLTGTDVTPVMQPDAAQSPSLAEPTSYANGRYEVKCFLYQLCLKMSLCHTSTSPGRTESA